MTEPKLKKELTAEIASRKEDVLLYGGIIPNPDRILQSKGHTRTFRIYEDLETDAHVRTVITKRKRAVTAREWFVNEADSSAEAVKAAELVRDCLGKINLDKITEDLLDAVIKGFSAGEIIWIKDNDVIRPCDIRSRQPQRFIFKQCDNRYEPRLLTLNYPTEGIELPDKKFIFHVFDGRFDNPYGNGLGNALFWPVTFKRKGITFWLTFCDKFGSPTTIGRYPASASEGERETLRAALESIANDYGITIPEGMEVSLLEAAKSSTDTYEKLVRYMDEQISEVVLGETGSTNQSNGGGSRARDEIGNEIRVETAKSDADSICDTLNRTLIKWIVELNMPGAPLPKLWRDFEEPEDENEKAKRDTSLASLGVRFTKDYFKNNYNLEDGDFELAKLSAEQRTDDLTLTRNFASEDNSRLDDILEAEELNRQMEGILGPVIRLVQEGKSYEDIMAHLVETYDFMNSDALMAMLDKAIFLANAKGRLDARKQLK